MNNYFSEGISKVSSVRDELNKLSSSTSYDDFNNILLDGIDLLLKGKDSIIDETINDLGPDERKITDLENKLYICDKEKENLANEKEVLSAEILRYQDAKNTAKKLKNIKVGIIGGHRKDINKVENGLKNIEPSITFKTTEAEKDKGGKPSKEFNQKYSNCDVILVFTDYAGHDLTGAAEKVAKKYDIKLIRENRHDLISEIYRKIIAIIGS